MNHIRLNIRNSRFLFAVVLIGDHLLYLQSVATHLVEREIVGCAFRSPFLFKENNKEKF